MNDKVTLAWQRYEAGRLYNNRLEPNQYNLVNTNVEFTAGNQWLHLPQTAAMSRLPKPVFNIIKRVTQLFVASLTSSTTTIKFEPLSDYESAKGDASNPDNNLASFATDEVENLLEKFKMEYRVREALFDGAQTGDYCAHFFFDPNARPYGGTLGLRRGEICMELVDGINVMFGNPNSYHVENQPYILVIGRDTVNSLRAEFRMHNHKQGEWDESAIQSDAEYEDQAGVGGKTELSGADDASGKCLYLYMYEKKAHWEDAKDEQGNPILETVTDKDGNPVQATDESGRPIINVDGTPVWKKKKVRVREETIHVTKATRNCVIYEDVDTGLSRYPIAWGNWERQKNQYHGRALVTGIIPNQIFINTMFAMVMRHLQLTGFPKTVYNADLIGQWNNNLGQAIGVRGLQPGQSISQMAYNMQPANMSDAITDVIDRALNYTKECLGATDVQMGTATPENTSALMVMQASSEVPLENPRSCLLEWVEDIGAILLDMMGTYYGERPMLRSRTFQEPVIDPATGIPKLDLVDGGVEQKTVTRHVVENFDFSQFKHLWFKIRADVGASTYFSEVAMVQTLDNLRASGTLDIIQYLERIPDKLIPMKGQLIEELKQARGMNAEAAAAAADAANTGAAAGSAASQQIMEATGGMPAPKKVEPTVGGELSMDKAVQALPHGLQAKFDSLPTKGQNALSRAMSLGAN